MPCTEWYNKRIKESMVPISPNNSPHTGVVYHYFFTVGFERFKNLFGRFGPNKRLGGLVVNFEIVFDRSLHFFGTPMRSTPYLITGDFGEPAFNEIQPGCTDGCEIKMNPGAAKQPTTAFFQKRLRHLPTGTHLPSRSRLEVILKEQLTTGTYNWL